MVVIIPNIGPTLFVIVAMSESCIVPGLYLLGLSTGSSPDPYSKYGLDDVPPPAPSSIMTVSPGLKPAISIFLSDLL